MISPSVLIFRAVLTKANNVALNMTVPSLFSGMFMATSLCKWKIESYILVLIHSCGKYAMCVHLFKKGDMHKGTTPDKGHRKKITPVSLHKGFKRASISEINNIFQLQTICI